MGLPLRITFEEQDYVYQIVNSKLIDQNTTELELLLNGDTIELIKDDRKVWILKDSAKDLDPEFGAGAGQVGIVAIEDVVL